MRVFERGWLSSNNVLCASESDAGLIDTGYGSHATQTVAMVEAALGGRSLRQIGCTHLHSDHCGGVAALHARFPSATVLIPPGEADRVARWDEDALSYRATGQDCPRFTFHGLLRPGDDWRVGGFVWRVLAAPGHDPHSVVLYEPDHEVLVSADALWEHGFGVVFPAIEGLDAFAEVSDTLDVIESLKVRVVIPGHGSVFTDMHGAVARSRARLQAFREDPRKHALHAGKVLLKFKLLEQQQMPGQALLDWMAQTPNFQAVRSHYFPSSGAYDFAQSLLDGLLKVGAARLEQGIVFNAERS
jgi:glyoxylase-like metal-dependent hydrolase (beta-lactamase superfamily II)